MLRRCSFALLFSLAFALAACQVEPLPDVSEPAASAQDTEAKVLQLLSVQPDGTLAFTDEGKAATLIGRAWSAAKTELDTLNRRIRSGQTKGFHSVEDLARYTRNQPTYLAALSDTGELNYTAASDPPDPKNPQCREKCPASELCCCGGLWIFCWSVCGCKP